MPTLVDRVKAIDVAVLKAEKAWLFPDDRCEWFGLASVPDVEITVEHWRPDEACDRFEAAFYELD